jgi:hypothetical protein
MDVKYRLLPVRGDPVLDVLGTSVGATGVDENNLVGRQRLVGEPVEQEGEVVSFIQERDDNRDGLTIVHGRQFAR